MSGGGRRRERGQALVVVLFLLLVLSMVAGLVATEIGLTLRAMDEATSRARLRALEDAGVAETLALLAAGRGAPVLPRELDGGVVEVSTESLGEGRLAIRVEATHRGFRSAVELVVIPLDDQPPRVLGYRPVPPAPAGGG